MISNTNLASISDKQNIGHIQDGGVQVNVEQNTSALRKTGRTSRKGSLQSSRNNSRCDSTERSTSPSKSDSWKCDTCGKLFENENDKLLTCEYFSNHRCINSLGMTQSVYKGISGRPDLPWFCSNCIVKSLECLKQTKSIEDRCADYMADFERKVNERMGKLELEVHDVKSTLDTMKSEIVDEVKQIIGNPTHSVKGIQSGDINRDSADTIIKQATHEMQSRMDRKNNIVMVNVNEQEGNIKEDSATKERETVIDIAHQIGVNIDVSDIINLKRVGKKNQVRKVYGEETVVPRLMVVALNENVKATVMENVYKLREVESDYYKKIGIKHGMTQDERGKEIALKKETKKKQDDKSGNFLYLVRGHPWERRIVKIRNT